MTDRVRAEVNELHTFFERWYDGTVVNPDDSFRLFVDQLDPDFQIVTADGRAFDRSAIIDRVAERRSANADDPMRIRIHDVQLRATAPELTVANYLEEQRTGTDLHRRNSIAVFRHDPLARHGLRWVHVHQIWYEDDDA